MNICHPVETEQGVCNVLHGHFRLAPRFVVYNTETDEASLIENQLSTDSHDLCKPLKSLRDMSVDVAIVGGIGRCDLFKFNAQGIKVFQASELKMNDNIRALKNGELVELTQENIHRGHLC